MVAAGAFCVLGLLGAGCFRFRCAGVQGWLGRAPGFCDPDFRLSFARSGQCVDYSALPMLPEMGVNTRISAWSSLLLVSEDICESPTNESHMPLDTRCSP